MISKKDFPNKVKRITWGDQYKTFSAAGGI